MMIARKISIFVLIALAIVNTSCRGVFYLSAESAFAVIHNEWTSGIYYYCPTESDMRWNRIDCTYPDTTICFTICPAIHSYVAGWGYIPAKESRTEQSGSRYLEQWFSYFPQDTISIFLFDEETVETVPWETVVKEYLVLQRYDLSIEDFKRLDNDIHYPPTPEMRDIHMWPPYEEAVKMRQ